MRRDDYVWQWSADGQHLERSEETATRNERRLFRLHRWAEPCRAKFLRIAIEQATDTAPVLREVEVYADASAGRLSRLGHCCVYNDGEPDPAGSGRRFCQTRARSVRAGSRRRSQVVWLGDFNEAFVAAQPRPLCALLSGNYLEWCQQAREPWRGVQEVLQQKNLPLWAACGGAQALAILQETGVDQPWDCPRCRDPQHPKSPVYSHIGHTGPSKCGQYDQNVWERGTFKMQLVARDPVLAGLGGHF